MDREPEITEDPADGDYRSELARRQERAAARRKKDLLRTAPRPWLPGLGHRPGVPASLDDRGEP